MKKGSIEEFTIAASILNDILAALSYSIMQKGYIIQKGALAFRSKYRDCINSYDMLSDPSERDEYVDSLIQECINNMGSVLQGKEFIKRIIRNFHHADDYCCPDYEIIDNVISKKGFIEAYKNIKYNGYKRGSCECTEREYFVFEFQDLYQKFKNRFLELCADGGFDYYEIVRSVFNPKETPATAPQEPQSPQLPEKLRVPKAVEIFAKAVEAGLMEVQGKGYKWLGQVNEYAAFVDCCSLTLDLRHSNGRIKWKIFKETFGMNEKEIRSAQAAKRDYDGEYRAKPDKWGLILNICK